MEPSASCVQSHSPQDSEQCPLTKLGPMRSDEAEPASSDPDDEPVYDQALSAATAPEISIINVSFCFMGWGMRGGVGGGQHTIKKCQCARFYKNQLTTNNPQIIAVVQFVKKQIRCATYSHNISLLKAIQIQHTQFQMSTYTNNQNETKQTRHGIKYSISKQI